jgi:hypothetical protein
MIQKNRNETAMLTLSVNLYYIKWLEVVRPSPPHENEIGFFSPNHAYVKKTNTIMVNEEKTETVIAPTHDSSVKSEN